MSAYNSEHLDILRAADDLRRGQIVRVAGPTRSYCVMALSLADEVTLPRFDALMPESDILITAERALTLKIGSQGWRAVHLKRPENAGPVDLAALADPTLDLARPLQGPFVRIEKEPDQLDLAALKIAKIARLLPAVLIAPLSQHQSRLNDFLSVDYEAVLNFELAEARSLREVARAHVPLAGAEDTCLVGFRPFDGGLEHIAIVIGDPERGQPVLTRLHSECFTGDLLASMKCDCGEQLRGAIHTISKAGGGIILYMAQEGRGIGLVSKLKAYELQDQGFDTVDANIRLGFDVDERVFAPAAEMLRMLGFSSVRLMTNNPSKIKAMDRFDIKVVERVRHAFPPNPHNEQYLKVKRDRTGHMFGSSED